MPVIRGVIYDTSTLGAMLKTLTLSALPPYGNVSAGAQLAKIGNQTSGSQIVLGGQSAAGQYTVSVDGTTLYAGPRYNPIYNYVHLQEFLPGAWNNLFASIYTSAGLISALIPVPGPIPPVTAFLTTPTAAALGLTMGAL